MKFKPWEELTITDDFMFSRVMKNEAICKPLIERIIDVKVGKIEFLSDQYEINISPQSKTIVMDVYLADEDKVINVEMQTGHRLDLPKRARYYQSASDVNSTPVGTSYRDLKDNYIIFICTFDPFDKNYPLYQCETCCTNYKEPFSINDGSMKVFLNTACTDLSALDGKLKSFYDYIRDGIASDDFTQSLDETISFVKKTKIDREKYMLYTLNLADARDEGFSQGKSEGLLEKAISTAKNLLKKGISPEIVAECTGLSLEEVKALQKKN